MERVIAQPQRGQVVAVPAQVVPHEEQVLVPQLAPRLFTQFDAQPEPHVPQPQEAPATAVAPLLSGQLGLGNSGRLKNSSHTFSANSSQGGISQKP